MVKKAKKKTKRPAHFDDWYVYAILFGISVLVRLPFLNAFDLVSYDGTYYINEAKGFLGATHLSGGFPIGYPLAIAALIPIVGDGVRAAQIVSFTACVGTLFVVYALGKRMVSRYLAAAAAIILAVTPLFVRLSLMTLSESLFIFWLFLGMLFFAAERYRWFALALGLAAITRPEALGVFLVLLLLRLRPARRLVGVVAVFAAVYLINSVVLSHTVGRAVILPKSDAFGISIETWKGREAWIDFEGRSSAEEELASESAGRSLFVDYLRRLPHELAMLAKHAMPMVLLLALYGMIRKRVFLLAAFLPLAVFPLATVRSEARFVLPYIPPLVLYAAVGVNAMTNKMVRRASLGLLVLAAVAGVYVNRDQLTTPVSPGFEWSKTLGSEFKSWLGSGEKIADRKPFFPFYAGAEYVEIPVGPYDDTIRYLCRQNVRFLVLHRQTIHTLRPALRPLLYDPDVIAGELRFQQVYFEPGTAVVYERTSGKPLETHVLGPEGAVGNGMVVCPAWSPDGRFIAYRSTQPPDGGGVYVVPAAGGDPRRLIRGGGLTDPISWAPDCKRIAFADDSKGNTDVYVFDLSSGAADRLTTNDAHDTSPSWSASGDEIVFHSDRGGEDNIWVKNLATGALTQLSSGGGSTFPAIAPDGERVAWIQGSRGLVIYNRATGARTVAASPRRVSFAPAWSPDGRVIAVTAQDWGGADVYLVAADGSGALLLTKTVAGNGMPSWSPDADQIAAVSNMDGNFRIQILTGVDAFARRVLNPVDVHTFTRPPE